MVAKGTLLARGATPRPALGLRCRIRAPHATPVGFLRGGQGRGRGPGLPPPRVPGPISRQEARQDRRQRRFRCGWRRAGRRWRGCRWPWRRRGRRRWRGRRVGRGTRGWWGRRRHWRGGPRRGRTGGAGRREERRAEGEDGAAGRVLGGRIGGDRRSRLKRWDRRGRGAGAGAGSQVERWRRLRTGHRCSARQRRDRRSRRRVRARRPVGRRGIDDRLARRRLVRGAQDIALRRQHRDRDQRYPGEGHQDRGHVGQRPAGPGRAWRGPDPTALDPCPRRPRCCLGVQLFGQVGRPAPHGWIAGHDDPGGPYRAATGIGRHRADGRLGRRLPVGSASVERVVGHGAPGGGRAPRLAPDRSDPYSSPQRGPSPRSPSPYDSASSPLSLKPPHASTNRTAPVATNTPRNAYTWLAPLRTSDSTPRAPQMP